MLKRTVLPALFNVAILLSIASAGDCCSNGCDDGCLSCPSCQQFCCQLKSEPSEEERYCWKVECKEICVPRVVFPWQNKKHRHGHGCSGCDSGCDSCSADGCCGGATCCDACRCNNGAFVVKVKSLKKHKYTCPSCKYSWTPVETCGGAGCCDSGCCDGGCDAGPAVMDDLQPEPAAAPDVPPAPPEPTALNGAKKRLSKAGFRALFSSGKVLRTKR